MNRNWKIAIIVLFLLLAWMRIAPAVVWRNKAVNWIETHPNTEYFIEYEWSWWSLRFTSVHPVQIRYKNDR